MSLLRIDLTAIHVCLVCGEFGTCKEGSLCFDAESPVPFKRQMPKYLHTACNAAYDRSAQMVNAAYSEGE